MGLHAGGLELVFAAFDEDVVAHDVFAAIVLVEAAGLGLIDEVVFEQNAGAALVGV